MGTELLKRLVQVARDERDIGKVVAYMLPENLGLKRGSERLGFSLEYEERMLKASLKI